MRLLNTLYAPAKINLSLQIVGKLPNGYHSLLGVMLRIPNLCDEIHVLEANAEDMMVECGEVQGANICHKVLDLCAQYNDAAKYLHVKIKKNIPIAAGMGGGSSDAASLLMFLAQHLNLSWSKEELLSHGLSIGSDVPFFLHDIDIAIAAGQGEKLVAIPCPRPIYILFVNPGCAISTPLAFSKVKQIHHWSEEEIVAKIKTIEVDVLSCLYDPNDLQEPAILLQPIIGKVLQDIVMQPGCIVGKMSGSGATCFGVFTNEVTLENAALQLAKLYPHVFLYKNC